MFTSRHTAWGCFAFLATAVSVCASHGYLPTAGPTPIRFLRTPEPRTNLVVLILPPAKPAEPVETPAPIASVSAEPAEVMPVETNSPLIIPSEVQPVAESATNATSVVEIEEPKTTVSPQMLLKYFSKGGSGRGTGVIVPVDFTAPLPTQAPVSSATYSKVPSE